MENSDLALQIGASISLFIAAAIVITTCVRNRCSKKPVGLKQSPSMEELTAIGVEDPSTNA